MKRTAFQRRAPQPRPCKAIDYTPRPRAVVRACRTLPMAAPVPKDESIRSKDYRMRVASMPCAHCGIAGFSQAAHGDQGKGMGTKACDSTCYPACGTRPGNPGCHWLIGTSGTYTQAERRDMESRYAEQTRAALGVDRRLQPIHEEAA